MMSPRIIWSIAAVAAFAMVSVLSSVAREQRSSDGPQRSQSFGSSVGPVARSVIASWQAHGADDGVSFKAGPQDFVPIARQSDMEWILDLAVFWRWPGEAPAFQQGSVGDEVNGRENVHRIVVGNRELRVQFDPQADTAQIGDGPLVQLKGANVLMLDVGELDIKVVSTARVEARHRTDMDQDSMTLLIERSPEVAAFVNRTR